MADVLRALQGRFILSLNDVPEVRQTSAGFRITPVSTTYSIGAHAGATGPPAELVIANWAQEGER